MRKGRSRGYLPGLVLLLSAVLPGSQGLEIQSIEGPSLVVNGSVPLLVLDCVYDLTDYDKTGLVLKWYFKRQPYPVYQWIPNHDPQDLSILKGRLKLDYEVSQDEYSKHRALAILNPTTELSGEYTCWISSFENDDFKRKMLTIYAPPSDITLTYSKPREDSVVVTCRAGGVFPAPDITIFRSSTQSVRRDLIEGAKVERQHFPELGYYNISVELEAFDYDLEAENMFECVLTIRGTNFEMREEILYFPGPPTTTTTTTTTTPTTSVPYEEDEDGEAEEDIKADNAMEDREGAKPHVAESVAGGVGRVVMAGSLSFVSILPIFFHYFHHH